MRYSILDPTGNITALVEDMVPVSEQPSVATGIMSLHPEVEQVGFVRFMPNEIVQAHLRMAGGEFCGNATMCAAALYFTRTREASCIGEFVNDHGIACASDTERVTRTGVLGKTTSEVRLLSSGVDHPLTVRLRQDGTGSFASSIRMPEAHDICLRDFSTPAMFATLPLVRMAGISHVIIEESSPLFGLCNQRAEAEKTVCRWCHELGADGLGLMFLDGAGNLKPLVYVRVCDTTFWEHSCASGSAAVGMYLAKRTHSPIDIALHEPGGDLRVRSDSVRRETVLFGHIRIVL